MILVYMHTLPSLSLNSVSLSLVRSSLCSPLEPVRTRPPAMLPPPPMAPAVVGRIRRRLQPVLLCRLFLPCFIAAAVLYLAPTRGNG